MFQFSTALMNANASIFGVGTAMNKGVIRVYGGTMPAIPDDATSEIVLAEISTNGIAYIAGVNQDTAGLTLSVSSPGTINKVGTWKIIGKATGVATWFRWYGSQVDDLSTSTGFMRIDGQVGSELLLESTAITAALDRELMAFQMRMLRSHG